MVAGLYPRVMKSLWTRTKQEDALPRDRAHYLICVDIARKSENNEAQFWSVGFKLCAGNDHRCYQHIEPNWTGERFLPRHSIPLDRLLYRPLSRSASRPGPSFLLLFPPSSTYRRITRPASTDVGPPSIPSVLRSPRLFPAYYFS